MFKKLLVGLLMICMVMSFCACGNNNTTGNQDDEQNVNAGDTDAGNEDADVEDENTQDDGKVKYTITVVDESGNPIAGAIVQMCKDSCIPSVTDANGVATFNVVEDEYKVSFTTLPEGYTYSTEEDTFYFDDGSYEMTITLKAAE